jgi:hypothetical protein
MATEKIKRVIIPKAKLPAYSGDTESYIVRYRIVSEDRNRNSHWSPQYKLPVLPYIDNDTTAVNFAIGLDATKKIISIAWTPTADINNEFDVYLKWDSADWVYEKRVLAPAYTVLAKQGATSVKVCVQIPTFPTKKFEHAKIFESNSISLVV